MDLVVPAAWRSTWMRPGGTVWVASPAGDGGRRSSPRTMTGSPAPGPHRGHPLRRRGPRRASLPAASSAGPPPRFDARKALPHPPYTGWRSTAPDWQDADGCPGPGALAGAPGQPRADPADPARSHPAGCILAPVGAGGGEGIGGGRGLPRRRAWLASSADGTLVRGGFPRDPSWLQWPLWRPRSRATSSPTSPCATRRSTAPTRVCDCEPAPPPPAQALCLPASPHLKPSDELLHAYNSRLEEASRRCSRPLARHPPGRRIPPAHETAAELEIDALEQCCLWQLERLGSSRFVAISAATSTFSRSPGRSPLSNMREALLRSWAMLGPEMAGWPWRPPRGRPRRSRSPALADGSGAVEAGAAARLPAPADRPAGEGAGGGRAVKPTGSPSADGNLAVFHRLLREHGC